MPERAERAHRAGGASCRRGGVARRAAPAAPSGLWSLRFASATGDPSLLDSSATLAPLTPQGTRSHWFHVTEGGTIRLGLIGVAGRAAKRRADDGTGADPPAETDADEHDDDTVCDLCGGNEHEDDDACAATTGTTSVPGDSASGAP